MKPKKNPKAELESRRPFFFLTGISIALVLAIMAFQWRTELNIIKDKGIDFSFNEDANEIPRTLRKMPQKPKPKLEVNKEKLAIVKDIFKDIMTLDEPDFLELGDEGDLGDEPVEIGIETDEEVETLPFILVEQIAMPLSCKDLGTRDEQIACLNQWMASYIRSEVKYPELARQMGLYGKVWITFVVGTSGKIVSAELARGEHDILNQEAMRVIESMPKWLPASQKRRKVKMTMTVPINFSF